MSGPLLLAPRLQGYAWGDPEFIPRLLGQEPSGSPVAEAWFGAHPQAPALVQANGDEQPLDALLAERGLELPYLLKLLAAARPLSIQVHPDRWQAQEGFAREEAAGIPRSAPTRSYRDPNHKPELILALTPFWALCGFRLPGELAAALGELPELSALLPGLDPSPAGLRRLIEAYFALPPSRLGPAWERLEARLLRAPAAATTPASRTHWLRKVRATQAPGAPADPGLLFVFLLNLVELSPGQAIFLQAGVPHAYLQGCGVEIMASSDNVLRAGLTPKHVDPPELMRIMRCEDPGPPAVLEPDERGVYRTPAEEFELRCLNLAPGGTVEWVARSPETLLALDPLELEWSGGRRALASGQACLLLPGQRCVVGAVSEARACLARVPEGA